MESAAARVSHEHREMRRDDTPVQVGQQLHARVAATILDAGFVSRASASHTFMRPRRSSAQSSCRAGRGKPLRQSASKLSSRITAVDGRLQKRMATPLVPVSRQLRPTAAHPDCGDEQASAKEKERCWFRRVHFLESRCGGNPAGHRRCKAWWRERGVRDSGQVGQEVVDVSSMTSSIVAGGANPISTGSMTRPGTSASLAPVTGTSDDGTGATLDPSGVELDGFELEGSLLGSGPVGPVGLVESSEPGESGGSVESGGCRRWRLRWGRTSTSDPAKYRRLWFHSRGRYPK